MSDSHRHDGIMLRAQGLRKTYRLGKVDVPVLKGASLEVRRGEWVAILGASGSGKSTLLHLLGDLDAPDDDGGSIEFEGRALDSLTLYDRNQYRNAAVGFVFQFYHLLPELNVLENAMLHALVKPSLKPVRHWLGLALASGGIGAALALVAWKVLGITESMSLWTTLVVGFGGAVLGALAGPPLISEIRSLVMRFGPAHRQVRERAAALLGSFGLSHRLRHRPRELSGGERQRVAIARALMNTPKVLLADEPTGNLDEATGREILDLIAWQHGQGLTILMVTHDESIAQRADRIVRLHDGRVIDG